VTVQVGDLGVRGMWDGIGHEPEFRRRLVRFHEEDIIKI
jgi:hypothetical protein